MPRVLCYLISVSILAVLTTGAVRQDRRVNVVAAVVLPSELTSEESSCHKGRCGSPTYFGTMEKMRPVISLAALDVAKSKAFLWTNADWLTVEPFICHCDNMSCASVSTLSAIMDLKAKVFFGPVCDYSLASVGRVLGYFSIPMISPGGFANDFNHKTEYPITRVWMTFNILADFVTSIFQKFQWTRYVCLYQEELDENEVLSTTFCKLFASTLKEAERRNSNQPKLDGRGFKDRDYEHNYQKLLVNTVAITNAGESC